MLLGAALGGAPGNGQQAADIRCVRSSRRSRCIFRMCISSSSASAVRRCNNSCAMRSTVASEIRLCGAASDVNITDTFTWGWNTYPQ